MCSSMIDSGKNYVNQQSLFTNSLWEMALCFKNDQKSKTNFSKIIDVFHDMNKFQNILFEQAAKTILNNFSSFLKEYVFLNSFPRAFIDYVIYSELFRTVISKRAKNHITISKKYPAITIRLCYEMPKLLNHVPKKSKKLIMCWLHLVRVSDTLLWTMLVRSHC